MLSPRLPAILASLLMISQAASAAIAWTFGPMVHYNWGRQAGSFSYGFEGSFWTKTDALPNPFPGEKERPFVGFDLGIEFDRARVRYYSEAQYGFYVGASVGPYLEISPGKPLGYGMQGSVWGVGLLGADVRARYGTRGFFLSPGAMAKVGVCTFDCEAD